MSETFDQAAVEAWLAPRLGADRVAMLEARRPSGQGYSAETVMFTAECTRGDEVSHERLVLRLENPEPAIYPSQSGDDLLEIEIQHRIMTRHRQPLAGAGGADRGLRGRPLRGRAAVLRHALRRGPGADRGPALHGAGLLRRRHARAAPHPRAQRAEGHGRPPRRRLAGRRARVARPRRRHARAPPPRSRSGSASGSRSCGAAAIRCSSRPGTGCAPALPADRSVGLCWGDPRPGNIIFDDFAPVCVTDFEASSIAAPEMDLGWWLMFDRTSHPDGTRLEGDPDRDEQRRIYFELSGRDPVDTTRPRDLRRGALLRDRGPGHEPLGAAGRPARPGTRSGSRTRRRPRSPTLLAELG